MHIKQLIDHIKLYHHITIPTANNYDYRFKIKEKHLIFFWSIFGQSITGYKKYSEMKQGMHVFSDVASVSYEAFDIFTLKQCWDSWMSVMNNTETPGIVTMKYKHIASQPNMNIKIGMQMDFKNSQKLHH